MDLTTAQKQKRKSKNPLNVDDVLTLWHSDLTKNQIAEQLNVTTACLESFATRNKFPKRKRIPKQKQVSDVDPTPEEIAKMAEKIREKRTNFENDKVNCARYHRVEIRQYAYDHRHSSFTEL